MRRDDTSPVVPRAGSASGEKSVIGHFSGSGGRGFSVASDDNLRGGRTTASGVPAHTRARAQKWLAHSE